jgi:hypothetical protein
MTPMKVAVAATASALVACVLWFGLLLLSPVMGPDTFGGESTCGSLGGLILRGGETRNNGGEISSEQFDARIDNCRTATVRSALFLIAPVGIGLASWWGAMTLSARNRDDARI